MPIHGEHFVGFDPTRGLEQFGFCPPRDEGATVVWFEKWAFTGWTFGIVSDTGITYNHSYAVFDMLGNVIPNGHVVGLNGAGFVGNTTCTFRTRCPSDNEWLAKARASVAKYNLPPPGTIQFAPDFARYIGR
jgi:hypothetical protein